jgi:hypothetical protein
MFQLNENKPRVKSATEADSPSSTKAAFFLRYEVLIFLQESGLRACFYPAVFAGCVVPIGGNLETGAALFTRAGPSLLTITNVYTSPLPSTVEWLKHPVARAEHPIRYGQGSAS